MILDLKKNYSNKLKRSIDKMIGGNNFGNSSSRKRSQRLLLMVLALGMAMVSVMLLHKLREGRVFGLLLQDQDRQILTLQLLLQRERENSKEAKRKLENTRAKNFILRTQKMELANKLTQTQTTADYLRKMQNEMETSLEEKQNQIKGLAEKAEESIRANLHVAALTELLQQKETEVKEIKQQLKKPSTPDNNTNHQDGTKENSTSSDEGSEVSNEAKSEQNENTPKEGKWVKVETNVDDEEPGGDGDVEASENQQKENPANSQENESKLSELKEQSEEPKNAEGKVDSKEEKDQAVDKAGETATSQESTTKVKEQSKELVAAQDAEQEKPENSQYGNENQVTPKEPTINAEGKEHKVRRNKNRGKGRRRRKATSGIKEDDKYGTKESNEVESEQKERARDTPKTEIPEGSQVDGSLNSQGQSNSEATAEAREEKPVSNDQRLENDQDLEHAVGSSKHIVEGEVEQSEKSENPQDNNAKNEISDDKTGSAADLNSENENDAEKQDGIVKEEADVNTAPILKQTEADDATSRDDEGSEVHEGDSNENFVEGERKEITSMEENSEKTENPQEYKAKNENGKDETGASVNLNTQKKSDADKQDGADVNTTSVTEQPDTDNAADDHQAQISEITTNTDDGSSIGETQDEEDSESKENIQNHNSQDSLI